MAESLDKFGEFLITNFRDSAIDHVDGLLSAHNKAPDLQTLQADLQRLTDEQRAIVRRCVIESIDSGLHDFLFARTYAVALVRLTRVPLCGYTRWYEPTKNC